MNKLSQQRSHQMAKIVDLEGVGPIYAQKLKNAGISTTNTLLEIGASPRGRKQLAEKSGIDETLILQWVNHADLYRIKGVGSEYSDLLEAAGVDTVVELSNRNAANLYQKLVETNEKKNWSDVCQEDPRLRTG
jgi:predicted flap endonuclease-1-like 5' DNA nuclease